MLLGLLITVLTSPGVLTQLQLGPSIPKLYIPSWESLKAGVLKAGLAQLPLTSLNSVIAVSHLAAQLFPDRVEAQGWRWRPGAVAVSVAAMNLVGCWFGAFPCCHGSGGLAAQVRAALVQVPGCALHHLHSAVASLRMAVTIAETRPNLPYIVHTDAPALCTCHCSVRTLSVGPATCDTVRLLPMLSLVCASTVMVTCAYLAVHEHGNLVQESC